MNLHEITVQSVAACDEARFQSLLDAHHYLGLPPKIGHTLWYAAVWRGQWLALLSFCAAATGAWKLATCAAVSVAIAALVYVGAKKDKAARNPLPGVIEEMSRACVKQTGLCHRIIDWLQVHRAHQRR